MGWNPRCGREAGREVHKKRLPTPFIRRDPFYPALNHTTTFEYDEVGNLIATVDPLGNRTLRFYDAVSRLIALIDPRGKTTQFTYDNLNRVTQIQRTKGSGVFFEEASAREQHAGRLSEWSS